MIDTTNFRSVCGRTHTHAPKMRCRVAGFGLLATPTQLPLGVIHSAARWPQPQQTSPSSARLKSSLYPGCNNEGGPSPAFAFDDRMERYVGIQPRRQEIGGCSTTAMRLGAVRLRACSTASTADGIRAHLKHKSTAIIFELRSRSEDNSVLAVYGKLHRLLGRTHSRQLLGPDAVATLTTLNFLVLHHRDGGPSLFDGLEEGGGGVREARLAMGHRRWDICGIGPWGPTASSVVRVGGEAPEPLVADQDQLEREIESVVKIVSRSEIVAMEQDAAARPRTQEQTSGASFRNTAAKARRHLRHLRARSRAKRELEQIPPCPPSSSTPPEPVGKNPFLGVGLGAFLSPRNCNAVLREARKVDRWAPWDGDLGRGTVATSLEDLPLSRAIWSGKAGDRIRERVAEVYGVPPAGLVVDAGGVFVCKVGTDGAPGVAPEQEVKGTWAGVQERAVNGAVQQEQQQQGVLEFRRSKSLITFCVALSAEDGPLSSLAVCLEQRGECVRLGGQGSGVVFSGKLRHASVMTSVRTSSGGEENSAPQQQRSPIFLLKGFASIRHPSVLQESARWQWGYPAWHVDAPWIKDQDILDRIWVAGDALAPVPAAAAADTTGEAGAVRAQGHRHQLERINSTLAHRYYRQGVHGMNVPVLDPLGRPVIDLIEDAGASRLVSWLPGVTTAKPAEVTLKAVLRRRFPWDRRRQIGKAGLSTEAGASPLMDAALQELFGASSAYVSAAKLTPGGVRTAGESLVGVRVPPIKYVFVDPRYRGLGLGKRLFLEAMRGLARRGFRFALIVVEDNGSGGLFGFYEGMGFVLAEELLGLPRAMIAPIPPPDEM